MDKKVRGPWDCVSPSALLILMLKSDLLNPVAANRLQDEIRKTLNCGGLIMPDGVTMDTEAALREWQRVLDMEGSGA